MKVIAKTVQETPPNAMHWSRATMAEAVGISSSSVSRIWADGGLEPHIVKGFGSAPPLRWSGTGPRTRTRTTPLVRGHRQHRTKDMGRTWGRLSLSLHQVGPDNSPVPD